MYDYYNRLLAAQKYIAHEEYKFGPSSMKPKGHSSEFKDSRGGYVSFYCPARGANQPVPQIGKLKTLKCVCPFE